MARGDYVPLVLRKGMAFVPVGNLQEQLEYKGFEPGMVDNIFGGKTESAVKSFQTSTGLQPTGIVDEPTWIQLFGGIPLPFAGYDIGVASNSASNGADMFRQDTRQTEYTQSQYGTYIIINLAQKTLTLYINNVPFRTYPVAVGKPSTPTPVGNFTILNKAVNPGGAYGTRWMAFTTNGHGIHGTNQPSSIGQATSNGCVRMSNADVEQLFDLVSVGTRVTIVPGETVQSQQTGAFTSYVVRSGDSLYSIAQRFGTTVDAIKRANGLISDSLRVGQVLRIPRSSTSAQQSTSSSTTTYTVRTGDSLYTIAKAFNTTVDAIKSANGLTSDAISIGQVLRIPRSTSSTSSTSGGRTYTVRTGDSLYSIARDFNTTVDAIKAANGLTSYAISIGQVLRIPGGSGSSTSGGRTYTVRTGDSLYTIARAFNTSVEAIKNANGLTSDAISIGQVLRIP